VNQRSFVASLIFTAVLVIAGGFLTFDAFLPSPLQHALMNVEGIVALSFLAILYARGRESELEPTGGAQGYLAVAAIVVVVSLAFAPIFRSPFLYDDYTHITDASRFTWRSVALQFGPVAGRGLFFRPVGFFFYWLNYLWARADPEWWHASSIALHACCSCLTYALCREVGVSRPASLGGALLFGLSGVSAEAVAWIDARFDLMATALVLGSLIFVCRYSATARTTWLAGALAAGTCAMLSKESGFCLPFLIASLALFRDRKDWKRIGRAASFTGVLAVVLFTYRWWAIGGIGGYSGAAGDRSLQFCSHGGRVASAAMGCSVFSLQLVHAGRSDAPGSAGRYPFCTCGMRVAGQAATSSIDRLSCVHHRSRIAGAAYAADQS
jgi:hypothetical protein